MESLSQSFEYKKLKAEKLKSEIEREQLKVSLNEKYISLMQNLSIYPVTNSDDVEKNYDRSEFQSRLCRNFFKSFINLIKSFFPCL